MIWSFRILPENVVGSLPENFVFQEFAVDLTFEDNIALQVNAEILHDLSNSSLITSLEMITNKREVLNKLAKHKPIRLWV